MRSCLWGISFCQQFCQQAVPSHAFLPVAACFPPLRKSLQAVVAIFAPLNYKWNGVLTGVAADTILSAVYKKGPLALISAFKNS